MGRTSDTDLLVGIVLVVLGVLVLVGSIALGALIWIGGVAAVVVGVLMLAKVLRGATPLAIVLIVLGALVLVSDSLSSALSSVLDIVVGGALVILGILKLMRKW